MKKLSFKTALGGMITALCLILMFSVGIFPVLVYAFPMLSSLLIYVLSYECGNSTALASYISVSLLSLILSPDKESALIFLAFFGYYPIINGYIERLKSKLVQWVIRFAIFNAAMVVSYFVLIKLFTAVSLNEFGEFTVPILLGMGNLILICYDIALHNVSRVYVRKLRYIIFKRK